MKRWLCEDSQYLQMDGKKVHAAPWSTMEWDIPSEQYVIQQFTGFVDRNGKDVYEGDFLGEKFDPITFYEGKFIARLRGARLFDLEELWEDGQKPEVIGNIFENSELFKNE